MTARSSFAPWTGTQIGSPCTRTRAAARSVKTMRGGAFSTGTILDLRSAPSIASACSSLPSDIVAGPLEAMDWISACHAGAFAGADGKVAFVIVMLSMWTTRFGRSTMV